MYDGKKICVIIPVLNEEKQLPNILNRIPNFVDDIVVIDDGSTDRSADIANDFGAIVISHQKNMGVGAAFHSGLKKVIEMDIDIMVNIDGDGQFNPEDIEKLIAPIIYNDVHFVTASRFKNSDYYPKMTKTKFIGNKIMSFLLSNIIRKKFYDVSCGFRAYSREACLKLNLFGNFTYTQETFIDLAFKKTSMMEIPLKIKGTREHGKSRVASNLIIYAYQTLKIILRSLRDHKPLTLFSIISLLTFLVGFPLFIFFISHYIVTGSFSPHKWAGFTAAFFFFSSCFFVLVGFILDMFARMRRNQEEMLFYLKNNAFKK